MGVRFEGEREEGRMKRRTRLMLSALSGVAAAALFMLYASGVRVEAEQQRRETLERFGGELVSVCVALRDIEPGEEIDEGNVAVEEWASSLLPADALTSLSASVGKTATSRIPRRAPLSGAYFERREDAASVPKGKVAVSVPSGAERAVGGALERGDSVDVYVTNGSVADRLTSAEVLDTSVLAEGGGDLAWVTLAVDPSAVRELLAATSAGAVSLVAPGDGVDTAAPESAEATAPVGDGGDAQ